MKKKLEAELISIAHRILKLKNKSEIVQLHQETQKLFEKLSVLRFVEENFGAVKPTIGYSEMESKLETIFEKEAADPEPTVADIAEGEEFVSEIDVVEEVATEIKEEEKKKPEKSKKGIVASEAEAFVEENKVSEPIVESVEEVVVEETENSEVIAEFPEEVAVEEETNFKPSFELSFESNDTEDSDEEIVVLEEATPEVVLQAVEAEVKKIPFQISLEDLLGSAYVDPVFVKADDLEREEEMTNSIPISSEFSDISQVISFSNPDSDLKSVSLNDRLSKAITIGLNDRIAFVKHLFGNSSEDYNRVLSQLITFDTVEEAKDFIEDMVKPDYNNWEGKEDYAVRFIEIVEKKFV
jgi:hypothetical protein